MGIRYRRLIPAVMAVVVLLGSGSVAQAVSGETAVLIPGAMPFKQLNPFYPVVERFLYPNIGIHFRDDDAAQLVDYSQNPLASDRAIREGVAEAVRAVRAVGGNVVVIGESMGSMVAARVATALAEGSDPPATDAIRFVLMAPPEVGVAEYFRAGTFIPILNYRVRRVPVSPYPTTIVIGEYDGWADPPDRPWNLVAALNAVLGAAFFVHGQTSFVDPADVAPENVTVEQNPRGALVTTYFVPTENLPLTQAFRLVLPDAVVDRLDGFLRPVVDAGYRRHDEPGDPRPYLSDGRIHRERPQAAEPFEVVSPEPVAPDGDDAVAQPDGEPTDRRDPAVEEDAADVVEAPEPALEPEPESRPESESEPERYATVPGTAAEEEPAVRRSGCRSCRTTRRAPAR